ncbi:hypothetical protein EHYA_05479 [Embleya hyalina]|uniref:Uncharacterized protein n=1 Tax=Embleya hyalina TaxID=516124 RepID=A0A401YT49_9ACTN|nr:hypothetical protein EHYA_05479 [Embleya hyalina]
MRDSTAAPSALVRGRRRGRSGRPTAGAVVCRNLWGDVSRRPVAGRRPGRRGALRRERLSAELVGSGGAGCDRRGRARPARAPGRPGPAGAGEGAARVPAASSGRAGDLRGPARALRVEEHPRARAGLVLAIAQPAREYRHEDAAGFARACWSDPARPPEVGVAAALGRSCLVDDPPPEDLRHVPDEIVTPELGVLMAEEPWIRQVDHLSGTGLTPTRHPLHGSRIPRYPGSTRGFRRRTALPRLGSEPCAQMQGPPNELEACRPCGTVIPRVVFQAGGWVRSSSSASVRMPSGLT